MPAPRYDIPTVSFDIIIRKGAVFAVVLTFRSGGTPIDLTGYHIRGEVRKTFTDEDPALVLTEDDSEAEDGIMALYALNDETDSMPGGTYATPQTREDPNYGFWEAELIDPNDNVYRVAEGRARMSRQVSVDD